MKKQLTNCLKAAWLAATVVVLVMGISLCAASEEACFHSSGPIFLLLILLSFPIGPITVYASLLFLEPSIINYPSQYYWLWLTLALGGFLQWFVVIPLMFRKRKLIFLDLKTEVPAATSVVAPAPSPYKLKRKPAIRPFDSHGRTPFERVIARHS